MKTKQGNFDFSKTKLKTMAEMTLQIEEYILNSGVELPTAESLLESNKPGQIELCKRFDLFDCAELGNDEFYRRLQNSDDILNKVFDHENKKIYTILQDTYGKLERPLNVVLFTQLYTNLLFFTSLYKPTKVKADYFISNIINISLKYKLNGWYNLINSVSNLLQTSPELSTLFDNLNDFTYQYTSTIDTAHTTSANITFYEEFLTFYSNKLRALLGIYQTPDPVVSFINKSVNMLLKKHFNVDYTDPVSSGNVNLKILDFATGTGTFLKNLLNQLDLDNLQFKDPAEVSQHFINIARGCELNSLTHFIAIYEIEYLLQTFGAPLPHDKYLNIININTLDIYYIPSFIVHNKFTGFAEIKQAVNKVQKDKLAKQVAPFTSKERKKKSKEPNLFT